MDDERVTQMFDNIFTPVIVHQGKIYFRGLLLNQLIKAGFACKMSYEEEYNSKAKFPDIILVAHYADSELFQLYHMQFTRKKQAPTIITSMKIDFTQELGIREEILTESGL